MGEASSFISTKEFENNYGKVWLCLNQKYDKTNLIVFRALELLYSQKVVKNGATSEFKILKDITQDCLKVLSNHGVNFIQSEPALIYILMNKLDFKSKKKYELIINNSGTLPTLEQFYEFLENKHKKLDNFSEYQGK